MVAAAAALVVGGCAMGLSWGAWGIFVTWSALTVVGVTAPALLLLPRSGVTWALVIQVASCAVWLMLIGWGLVALLHPEYTVGWTFPGRAGVGADIDDEDDAWRIGWTVLGLGVFCLMLVIAVEIIPRIRRARAQR